MASRLSSGQPARCPHSETTSCMQPSSQQVAALLRQAEALCAARKLRFTALRRQVLSLICRARQPQGAYQLLEQLQASGRSAAPPTVYRALDFLLEQGLIHRLASNNTYLACVHPDHPHESVFLVCRHCGDTRELHTRGVNRALRQRAAEQDFAIEHLAVEISGACRRCSHKRAL